MKYTLIKEGRYKGMYKDYRGNQYTEAFVRKNSKKTPKKK